MNNTDNQMEEQKMMSKNKANENMQKILRNVADISKKAGTELQKSFKTMSEQYKKSMYEQRMKKYNPLFANEYFSDKYCIPNVIKIVDDAERRGIDVCDGAMGWTETVNGVEVLCMYDEFINESGLQFVPVAKCNDIYCVDNFDRTKFINANYIFGKTAEEKLAELEHIAYSLGATRCTIEIVENRSESETQNRSIGANISRNKEKDKQEGVSESFTANSLSEIKNKQEGKTVSYFEGGNSPTRPQLKWFAHDDNIKRLIEMRCTDKKAIRSKRLELSGSIASTMSHKTACAIDIMVKTEGKIESSLEKKAVKENNTKLVFEVEF